MIRGGSREHGKRKSDGYSLMTVCVKRSREMQQQLEQTGGVREGPVTHGRNDSTFIC